ncbi:MULTISPECIES: amidase family protein [unclassified Sphingomonas]|uniref:amidase family protein n=1 Tax=unclassified Sphingomonas TaxID=196159 RepID=UPI000AB2D00A|nr:MULTISPECIES: amidase family protein [unclassified Sphingomonas]
MNRRECLLSATSALLLAAPGAKALASRAPANVDPANLSVQEIIGAFRTGRLSPVAYMEHVLKRIEVLNPKINAFFFTDPAGARAAAAESERRWAAGRPMGPLDGLPFSAKDSSLTRGMPSPQGLTVNRDMPPGDRDAPAIARLREAGAILIGKNTQPELASLASCISGLYGIGRNPWDFSKTPGGSSGGSGAAVAADMVPLAIGGDSGGSIRIPAAHCGVVGVKASFGRIPLYPPVASSTTTGPFVRRASDIPFIMNLLTRPDASDPYALPYDGVDYTRRQPDLFKGKRIGFTDWFGYGLRTSPGVATAFRGAINRFRNLGATLISIDAPFDHDPFDRLAPMFAAGARKKALTKTGGRLDTLLPVLQAWFEEGKDVTPEEMEIGLAEQKLVIERMNRLMEEYDFLLTPTSPITAHEAELAFPPDVRLYRVSPTRGPECGRPGGPNGIEGSCRIGEHHSGWFAMVPFTFPFNYSGHPAISIPCGLADGLPVGLQVVGRKQDDFGCVSAAIALEEALDRKFVSPLLG